MESPLTELFVPWSEIIEANEMIEKNWKNEHVVGIKIYNYFLSYNHHQQNPTLPLWHDDEFYQNVRCSDLRKIIEKKMSDLFTQVPIHTINNCYYCNFRVD